MKGRKISTVSQLKGPYHWSSGVKVVVVMTHTDDSYR